MLEGMLEKIIGALILAGALAYVVDAKRRLRRELAHARSIAIAAHNLAIALINRGTQPAPRVPRDASTKGTDGASLN